MSLNSRNLIWIDLEMTGLNPLSDVILEIATLVTDAELNILAEGPELVIHQPQTVLDAMDEWNQTHHGQSGLIDRVLSSGITVEDAEQQTLAFLKSWVPEGVSPICGNSICQDRRFLARGMPRLEKYFTTGIWMSPPSRSSPLAGPRKLPKGLKKPGATERWMTFGSRSKNCVITVSTFSRFDCRNSAAR